MIEDLKEALAQTIRSSAAVNEAARKIRREGLNLHLVLSFENGGDDRQADSSAGVTRSIQEPAFRLNGNDVTLLEALGIDPTRRVRMSSRKRRRPPLSETP